MLIPKRDSLLAFSNDDPVRLFKRHIVRQDERSDGDSEYWNLLGEVSRICCFFYCLYLQKTCTTVRCMDSALLRVS